MVFLLFYIVAGTIIIINHFEQILTWLIIFSILCLFF